MKSTSSLRFMARILWLCIAALVPLAEIVAVVIFRKIPNHHLFPGPGMKYLIVLVVALPMIAGLNGYYSVKRRLSSATDDVTSVLSIQFLITIVIAYTVLLVCMEPMTEAMQRLLR